MAQSPSRERSLQKAKQLRSLQTIIDDLGAFIPRPSRKLRKEILLPTEFGKVRTLWYGFDTPEAAPVFFDLHGGGFVLGSAEMDEAMCLEFKRKGGCKVISIDYAKAPEFPYPAAVNEAYAAAKHVWKNAAHYGIDPDKMAIGGHSAGANLSTVACMKAKEEGLFHFVAQILDYPPLDLATDPREKPQPKGAIPPEMARMFNECYVLPAQARHPYASPVYATRENLQGLPPALFILAGGDSLHDEGLRYCEMLKAAGVATECHEYPKAGHGFTYKRSADSTDALEKMSAFLRKYCE